MINTLEELLQDYARYSFMEGTIDENTCMHLIEDVQNYILKIKELELLELESNDKRKINVTFEVEDNDVIMFNFEHQLRNRFDSAIIDFRLFPKTEHLKENESFKKLVKAKREAGLLLDRFINDNR